MTTTTGSIALRPVGIDLWEVVRDGEAAGRVRRVKVSVWHAYDTNGRLHVESAGSLTEAVSDLLVALGYGPVDDVTDPQAAETPRHEWLTAPPAPADCSSITLVTADTIARYLNDAAGENGAANLTLVLQPGETVAIRTRLVTGPAAVRFQRYRDGGIDGHVVGMTVDQLLEATR